MDTAMLLACGVGASYAAESGAIVPLVFVLPDER